MYYGDMAETLAYFTSIPSHETGANFIINKEIRNVNTFSYILALIWHNFIQFVYTVYVYLLEGTLVIQFCNCNGDNLNAQLSIAQNCRK